MRTRRWIEAGAAAALLIAVAAAVGGYVYVRTLANRLVAAARAGEAPAVAALLAAGTSPDTVHRNQYGGEESVLRIAASRGHLEVVRLLLDRGADVDRRDRMGVTTLWWVAATEGRVPRRAEVARLLLERGADPNVGAERWGRNSVLAWAAVKGDPELVRVLLKHGARLHQTIAGAGELQAAAKAAAIKRATVDSFRRSGVPPDPLLEREFRGQEEVVRLLRTASASQTPNTPNTQY